MFVILLQEFVVRNDCPCGSTIGPIVSGKVGILTSDWLREMILTSDWLREMMTTSDLRVIT